MAQRTGGPISVTGSSKSVTVRLDRSVADERGEATVTVDGSGHKVNVELVDVAACALHMGEQSAQCQITVRPVGRCAPPRLSVDLRGSAHTLRVSGVSHFGAVRLAGAGHKASVDCAGANMGYAAAVDVGGERQQLRLKGVWRVDATSVDGPGHSVVMSAATDQQQQRAPAPAAERREAEFDPTAVPTVSSDTAAVATSSASTQTVQPAAAPADGQHATAAAQ